MRFTRYLSLLAAIVAVTAAAPVALAQTSPATISTTSTSPAQPSGGTDQALQFNLTTPPTVACVDNSAVQSVSGQTTEVITVTGTWSGVISWFAQADGVPTWKPLPVYPQSVGIASYSTSANGQWFAQTAGYAQVCGYFTSTAVSGTAVVTLRRSSHGRDGSIPGATQGVPFGFPLPGSIYGWNGGPGTVLLGPGPSVTPYGQAPRVSVANDQDAVQRYRCAASFTPYATGAVTLLSITGSATKTVHITRITLSGHSTANAETFVGLQRTSALGTGGTASKPTIAALDSRGGGGAATAVCTNYTTAAQSAGTAVGGLITATEFYTGVITTPTVTTPITSVYPEVGASNDSNIVLRGTSDFLELQNLNGGNLSGSTVLEDAVEFYEDNQ